MINKLGHRGEDTLMKNVLSVIIFVISFALIVYGVYKIYTVFLNNESKNLQNTLDKISAKIDTLKEGESTTVTIQGFRNSNSWRFASWSKSDSVDSKPDKCYFKTCICICPGASEDRLSTVCREKSLCNTFDQESISIDTKQQISSLARPSALSLPKNIEEMSISLNQGSIKIVYENTQSVEDLNKIIPQASKINAQK
jgi:hypothetical protein